MVNRVAKFLSPLPLTPMPRRDHPKSQLATTIPHPVHDAVRDFSDASGVPIAQIVEDALRRYLKAQYWPIGDEDGEQWRGHHG